MLIESPYATSYLLAIGMFAIVDLDEIFFADELIFSICMCKKGTSVSNRLFPVTFRLWDIQSKYALLLLEMCLIFVGNSNVCPICHRLRDILS